VGRERGGDPQGSSISPLLANVHLAYHAIPGKGKHWRRFAPNARGSGIELSADGARSRLTWERMTTIADAWLPPTRILHPWPEQRLAALIRGKSRMQ
jgi:hypothetical protein